MPWPGRKRKNESSLVGRGRHLLDAAVLEKRLLFSATPIAPPVEVASSGLDAEQPLAVDVTSSDTVADGSNGAQSDHQSQQSRRLELVFVDAGVEDYQQLLDDLRSDRVNADLEIYLLDGLRDGVDQVGEILSGYTDVDAVHFVSHGTQGQFQLGNTWLSIDNLDGHAGAIASWNDSLRDGADLLIYGCDLAASDDGRALAEALATLCDCDVAASDDDTGHAILGGDWDLEFATGTIETDVAFSLDVQQNWGHLLDVTVGNTAVFTTPSFTGSDSTSFDVGSGTDQLLLVSVSFGEDKGNEVANITFDGVGLTKIGERQDADKARVEIWALVNPASGNQTLNITYSGTAHEGAVVGVMSFNDVDQSTPLGVFASAQGDSSGQSVAVATAPTDIVFGVLAYSDSNDHEFTAVNGSERWETFVGKTNATASTQSVAGTLSVNAQWSTSNNSTWVAAGVSIKSATVSGAPSISGLAGDTLNYNEDDAATVIEQGGNVAVIDGDSTDFNGGVLQVSITSGGASDEDVLGIRNEGNTVGQIGVSGSDVTYNFGAGAVTIGSFSGGSGGNELIVSLNSNADGEAAEALIENITYLNTDTDNPTTSSRTVCYTLYDGEGGRSADHNTTVNVAAVNDAATLADIAGDGFAYIQGAGALLIDQGGDAVVADVDSSDFDSGSLSVSIVAGNDASEDVLAIRNQGTNPSEISVVGSNVFYNFGAGSVLIGTWAGGSGGADLVVTLNSSADAAATSALLRNITYENTDTVAATTGTRTIRFTVNDGDGAVSLDHDATVNVVQGAPGGVLSGLALWLRADAGVTIGLGGVSQWENQVVNATLPDLQQAISTQRPDLITSGLNFHPIVSFDGIDDHLADLSVLGSDLFGTDSASLFLAGSTNASGGVMLQWIDTLSNRVNLEDDIRFDFGDLTNDQLNASSPSAGYHIINAQATPGSPAGLSINIDGRQTASGNASVNAPLDNTQFGQFFLGEYPGGGFNDDLDVGEVVIFSSDLNMIDRLKVNSYLAIKYGLTLDQTTGTSYFDSTGSAIWNSAANLGFDHDIAGIGQDNASLLAQNQSRSINADAIVTVSGASNQNDREFLIWGNDDGALGEVAGEPAGIANRLARIWRVQEAGDVGTTTISFDLSGLSYTGTTAADFNLIIDNNTDFSTGTTLMTATGYNAGSGIVTFTGVNLADGDYFSLGTSLPVNTVPTINNLAGDTLNYSEGDAAMVIEQGTNVAVTDGDSADFDTGNLTVSVFAGGDAAEDILAVRDQGPGVGNIRVSGSSVLYDFGGGPVVIGTFTGGSGGADLVVTFNANATAISSDALIENITYRNSDTDHPTNTSRTIRFTLNDGDGGTSVAHDVTVNVAAVNDSPAFSGLDQTPTFVEGGAAVILDNNATIADAELGAADDFSGATVSLVRNGGANADDVFDGSGTLGPLVQGGNLVVGATTIGTVTTNSGGLLVLTFNSNATAARVNSVLQQITYANSSVMPPSSVQVGFTFDDGNAGAQGSGGALTDLGSVTVNLTSVNTSPTIDLDANNSSGAAGADFDTTFTEGGGPVAISDSADAVLADIDSPSLTQLSIVISNLLNGTSETLSADTSGTSITATYAAGTLTLSGTDTVVNYQQVLRTIAYNNTSANPDATTRLIQFVAHDGAANSNVAAARVDIVTVNDAPTAAGDNFVTQVGKILTIGAGGLLANDFDLDGNALTVIPVSGPITGTLTLAADGSFQFTPAANFTGSITFTYAVTDGIATSTPTTVTIQVAKPNDFSEVTPAEILSAGPDPEPEPETLPEPPAEEEDIESDDESELATAIIPDTSLNPDAPLVFTGGVVIETTDDEILTLSIMPSSTPDLTDAVQESERIASLSDSHADQVGRRARSGSTRSSVSILGIAKFDSKLLWGDMENLQDDIKQSDIAPYYFAGTFAGFSGALSVGYVMWTVRGGLLATSLLAHLPAWSFVDPLLVLSELDDDDDTDDDSLEEMLDKTEKERENNGPVETEDQTVLPPTASGETVI